MQLLAAAEEANVREMSRAERANWRSKFRQQTQLNADFEQSAIIRSLEHSAMHTEQKRLGDLVRGEKVES